MLIFISMSSQVDLQETNRLILALDVKETTVYNKQQASSRQLIFSLPQTVITTSENI